MLAQERVSSPDGRITVTANTDGEGVPYYEISRDGQVLIAPSQLGFLFTDADPMRRNFALSGVERGSADARWEQPWGERRFVTDRHNAMTVTFREKGGAQRSLAVQFRVFDDGVGFRYDFPENTNGGLVNIAEELTEFVVAPKGTAWWIQGGDWNRYEYLYQKTDIGSVSTAHTPITMRLDDGTHLSFHEAALVDYAGYWFKRFDGQRFRTHLSPSSRGPKVVRRGGFVTPWRAIRIADSAAGLVESDLELNLNEPNRLGDISSWFRPQKYIGIWWGMIRGDWTWAQGPRHGATTARAKQYIDFAARHGFAGVLIEGWNIGWDGNWFGNGREYSFTQPYPDFDLEQVAAYARSRGVQLVGHHETGGNIANYEKQLDDALALYDRLNVRVVKTGYVADAGGIIACNADAADPCRGEVFEWHDGQRQVQHHLRVVEAAARHRIAINPHEPVKDTGLRRTYPSWVAREGARGQEYNAWSRFGNGPDHDPTLVYTRMLAGPMDYTPGVLSLVGDRGMPFSSTLAKQLGLYLAIYSPIQMAADFIENLEAHPRELAFIKQVPADWEDSRLVAGEVGDYAIFARKDRNSADWYVGGVNDATRRDVTVQFAFLDPRRTYEATVFKDAPGATYENESRHTIAYETITLRAGDTRTFELAPGGGLAIRLTPERR
nr:glycoside hydrolase family 97 protein [Qipengyuania thermophila]